MSFTASVAGAIEMEVVPCVEVRFPNEKPYCCLKRTDTDFVLYLGDREVKRFTNKLGANVVGPDLAQNGSLKDALQTLLLMRESGACR